MKTSNEQHGSLSGDAAMGHRISVIMPAHNAEAYVGEAIDSVRQQTFADWELIVVNDGSTDETETRVRSFDDPRIICMKAPRRFGKPSAARNYGARAARGEFLFFLDADDLLTPDALQALIAALDAAPRLAMVYGFLTHIDPQGNPLPCAGFKLTPIANGGYRLPDGYVHCWERIATLRFVASLSFMIRKAAFEATGGFNETLDAAEDIGFYLHRFLEDFHSVGVTPHYLVRYRQHPDSLTKRTQAIETLLNAHLRVVEDFYADARLPESCRPYYTKAICKAYNYVAGVRLARGDKATALGMLLRAWRDPRTKAAAWLSVCLTTLLRCLLPTRLDARLKSLAVEWRDGVIGEKSKKKIKQMTGLVFILISIRVFR